MPRLLLGQYEVMTPLGKGGQGTVHKCRDRRSGRTVCAKVIQDAARHPEAKARAEREAGANILHPHVVQILASGWERSDFVLVMSYIDGRNLADHIAAHGALPESDAVTIAKQLASGLEYLHQRNLIHRDMKPQNVLIDGVTGDATIIDLGIARSLAEASMTRTGQAPGTFAYMAPELFTGQPADARSDVYALGLILYESLVGIHPTGGCTEAQIIHNALNAHPVAPSQLTSCSSTLDTVCLRALAKEPAHRFQTADAFGDALASNSFAYQPQPISAGPAQAPSQDGCIRCLACGGLVAMDQTGCGTCGRWFMPPDRMFAMSSGPLTGQVFRIPEGTYDVGRAVLCRDDTYISRRQFRVRSDAAGLFINSGGGCNATCIDHVPVIAETRITPSAEVRFAAHTAVVTT